jgi:hypothetical protein
VKQAEHTEQADQSDTCTHHEQPPFSVVDVARPGAGSAESV